MTPQEQNKIMSLMKRFKDDKELEHADMKDVNAYKNGIEKLCEVKEPQGLLTRGFAAYCGNRVWPQN